MTNSGIVADPAAAGGLPATSGRPARRTAALVAAAVAGGLATAVLGVSAYAARRLSRPSRSFGEGEPEAGCYERVTFPAADGIPISGWFLPGAEGGCPLVLCHGFHTGRREMLPLALGLRERGHHILTFDFRAHGESGGHRTSAGLRETGDLEGAVRYLLARPEVNGGRVGVVGFSLGGAIAIMGSARLPQVGAVVADSAFASLREVVPSYFRAAFPLPAFPFAQIALWFGERITGVKADHIRPMDAIGNLSPRPILLIHGTEDRIVPLTEAYLLYESALEPREIWVVPGADHVGARMLDFEAYVERVDRFLRTHLMPVPGSLPR